MAHHGRRGAGVLHSLRRCRRSDCSSPLLLWLHCREQQHLHNSNNHISTKVFMADTDLMVLCDCSKGPLQIIDRAVIDKMPAFSVWQCCSHFHACNSNISTHLMAMGMIQSRILMTKLKDVLYINLSAKSLPFFITLVWSSSGISWMNTWLVMLMRKAAMSLI